MARGSLVVLLCLLTACEAADSSSPAPSATGSAYFSQHGLTGQTGLPTGDFAGRLRLVHGCLVLEGDGASYLALWPRSHRLDESDPPVVRSGTGAIVARAGERIHVGGGLYGPDQRSFVARLIGGRLDQRCEVDGYWLVSEVLP